MTKLGVGVIGCGGISTAHLAAYRALGTECEVIAVCDANEAAARARAAQFAVPETHTDYRRLLDRRRATPGGDSKRGSGAAGLPSRLAEGFRTAPGAGA